jgi:hypothetical protein
MKTKKKSYQRKENYTGSIFLIDGNLAEYQFYDPESKTHTLYAMKKHGGLGDDIELNDEQFEKIKINLVAS